MPLIFKMLLNYVQLLNKLFNCSNQFRERPQALGPKNLIFQAAHPRPRFRSVTGAAIMLVLTSLNHDPLSELGAVVGA